MPHLVRIPYKEDLPALVRILAPKKFIDEFLIRFIWRRRGLPNVLDEDEDEDADEDEEGEGEAWLGGYQESEQQYFVSFKFFHDMAVWAEHRATLTDARAGIDGNVADLILSYSQEYQLGEICYFFPLSRGEFLEALQPNLVESKRGPAWNMQRVCTDICRQYPQMYRQLRFGANFRATACILQSCDRVHSTLHGWQFFSFLFAEVTQDRRFAALSSDTMPALALSLVTEEELDMDRDVESGALLVLPVWNTAYPDTSRICVKQRQEQEPESESESEADSESEQEQQRPWQLTAKNTFSDELWTDYTLVIRPKLHRMGIFENGIRVAIHGLVAKPEWNDRNGVIDGYYDFKSERWPVKLAAPTNRTFMIKTANLMQSFDYF